MTPALFQSNSELATPDGNQNLSIVEPSALEAITRGEIDCQITTAHRFPRSMQIFKGRAITMACFDQETAESCIYVRPVGKKDGKMQYAEGLSVRMAEIVGASYGNLRVGSMIVEQTDRYVVTRGFAHDLESNFASTSEVKEPTVTKDGKPFTEGMRAVIAKAALSKARRDATFQVVPKALCRPIELEARRLIAGDAKSIAQRIAAAVSYVQRLNIDPARVWSALGIAGESDLTSELLLTLTGIRNAIRDNDTTIDEAFPTVAAKPQFTNKPAALGDGKPTVTQAGADNAPTSSTEEGTRGNSDAQTSAPAPSAPAASNADEPPLATLGRLMQADEIGEPELVKWAVEKKLLQRNMTLSDMTPQRVTAVIEDWEKAKSEIIAKRR